MHKKLKFGSLIRKNREKKRIGLREMAKLLSVSPTYLSKVERGLELPPKEERIQKIAEILELQFDILIAAAGRVPSELVDLYMERPAEVMALLRKGSSTNVNKNQFISTTTKNGEQ